MDSIASTAAFDLGVDHANGGATADTDIASKAEKAHAAEQAARSSTIRLLAAAAGTGAVAAAIVGFAIYFLLPPQRAEDVRVPIVARDIEELKQQLLVINDKLRTLETGAVSATESMQALSGTVHQQTDALTSVQKGLAAQTQAINQRWEEQNRIATPALMGVAVVQLRDALIHGQRFDWELVNLWGIAGRQPDVTAELAKLAPLARGVLTKEQIKAELEALLPRSSYSAELLRGGVYATEWLTGLGNPPTDGSNSDLLYRAIDLVGRGDYAGAGRELQKVDPSLAEQIAPVLADVKNSDTALAACGRLMVMAKKALEAQGQAYR